MPSFLDDCSIDGCDRPVRARGWCVTHLQRFYRTGSPTQVRKVVIPGDLAARFWGRVETSPGCWEWQGTIMGAGYGQVGDGGRLLYAHRVAYELTHGSIPDGLHIDHLCRNRACVRPSHLEAVTQAENNRRSVRVREASRGL